MDTVTVDSLWKVRDAVKGARDLTVKFTGVAEFADNNSAAKALSKLENAGPVILDLTGAKISGYPAFNGNHDLTVRKGTFLGGRVRANDPAGVVFEGQRFEGCGFVAEGGRGLTLRGQRFVGGGFISIGVSTRNNPVRKTLIEGFEIIRATNDGIKLGAPQDVTVRDGVIYGQWPSPGQHLDAIQCLLGPEPSHNVHVERVNVVTRAQGINFGSRGDIPYINPRIVECDVVAGAKIAIGLGRAIGGEVRDNRIRPFPGATAAPTLYSGKAVWEGVMFEGARMDGARL